MENILNFLKKYINAFILSLILIIGSTITYTNLSFTFNLSLSSNNKKAIYALERLNRFPEGLKLINLKNLNELTEKEFSKFQNWLDKTGKSKSRVKFNSQGILTIETNYNNDFDLANYLKKLFLIPHNEIKYFKINNIEKRIIIEIS